MKNNPIKAMISKEEGPRTERISVPLPSVTGTNYTDVNIKQLLAE